jgi:hypothetical protein
VSNASKGAITPSNPTHVNDQFVRWLGSPPVTVADRVYFFALAAKTMRRILFDHVRVRGAEKRGGDQDRITLIRGRWLESGGTLRETIRHDQHAVSMPFLRLELMRELAGRTQ